METLGNYRIETTADYRIRINRAMHYMHAHISTPLSIEKIAAHAYFSPFHFHRVFRSLTGETIGSYLTRTRMTKAATLLERGAKVADAGAAVGYQSASAFIKGFKKTFGTSPARRPANSPLLFPRTTVKVNIASPDPQPQIRELPDLPILYVTKGGIALEFFDGGQVFDVLDHYLYQAGLSDKIQLRLGLLRNTTSTNTEQWCFDACVVPDSLTMSEPRAPVKQGMIHAGLWAVFSHVGAYDTLWQTWSLAYNAWLPNSAARLRNVPPFEVYLDNKHTTPPEKLHTEIYLPIAFG